MTGPMSESSGCLLLLGYCVRLIISGNGSFGVESNVKTHLVHPPKECPVPMIVRGIQ